MLTRHLGHATTRRAIHDEQHVLVCWWPPTRERLSAPGRVTSASGARERPERIATGRAISHDVMAHRRGGGPERQCVHVHTWS